MRDHVKVLAFLHIALGAMGSLGAVVILGVFTFGGTMVRITADNDPEALLAAPVIFVVGVVLFAIILVCSVPGLVAGIGLLDLRPWARILAIVVSAFHLFNIPIGTAVGIYGLWVLLNSETEEMFRSTASTLPISP